MNRCKKSDGLYYCFKLEFIRTVFNYRHLKIYSSFLRKAATVPQTQAHVHSKQSLVVKGEKGGSATFSLLKKTMSEVCENFGFYKRADEKLVVNKVTKALLLKE